MLPKPPGGYLERGKAEPRLNHYIYAGRFDGPEPLPKRADPAQVDELVKKALDSDSLNSRQVAQSGRLMRFFNLAARAEQVTKFLNRRESKDDETIRSLVSIAILGDMGSEPLQAQAADYYRLLAAKPSAEQRFPHFIDMFFYLTAKADPKWIVDPIEKKMKQLEPEIEKKLETKAAYLKLKNLRDDRLPRILSARTRRIELAQMPDDRRRRHEIIRCYLRLEVYAYVEMKEWAAMMLQRDADTTTPQAIADAFAQMLSLLMAPASVPDLHKDDENACVTSCARALEFYGGQPTESQAQFIEKKKNEEQSDLLYWDPETTETAPR